MSPYAADTSVPVDRSQREIEMLVTRYGAKQFFRGAEPARAVIGFALHDRRIQFELPLPHEGTLDKRGKRLKPDEIARRERALWRALALCIKAKFVSIESGVETFEEAFLASIVVPGTAGAERFARQAIKAIQESYTKGKPLPPLLPSGAP